MATEIKLPRLGQGMESGTVVRWLKQEGDRVEKGEPLYELDTEKVTQEVEADASGVLLKITVQEGEVPVGQTIAVIGEEGEAVPESEPKPAPEPEAEPRSTRRPRRRARGRRPGTRSGSAGARRRSLRSPSRPSLSRRRPTVESRRRRLRAASPARRGSSWRRSAARARKVASSPKTSSVPWRHPHLHLGPPPRRPSPRSHRSPRSARRSRVG